MEPDRTKSQISGASIAKAYTDLHCGAESSITARRHELEEEKLVTEGFRRSASQSSPKATVDVFHAAGTGKGLWVENIEDKDLRRLLQAKKVDDSERSVTICFIKTPIDSHTDWLEGNFSISESTVRILQDAGLSNVLLGNIYSNTGYWAKMGDQQFSNYDDKDALVTFQVCYQYRCGWDSPLSFTHFIRTSSHTTYFCINYPASALSRLRTCFDLDSRLAYRDYHLDALAADASGKQWLLEIDRWRTVLREHERALDEQNANYKTATNQLHALSRVLLSLCQDIEDFQAQLVFLQDSHATFTETLAKHTDRWYIDKKVSLGDSFRALQSHTNICVRWTKAYHSRTNECINLLFQLDNKKIQEDTAKVAIQTQQDSASMIVIATMTLFFLPGTFVSSILSTTFFNYAEDGLQVSRKGWVLVPTIVPLTALIFSLWLAWLWKSRPAAFGRLTTWLGRRTGQQHVV